jgi:hypothetical protein
MVDTGDGRAVLVVTLNDRVQCSKKNIVARLRALLQDILMKEQITCHAKKYVFISSYKAQGGPAESLYIHTHNPTDLAEVGARHL